MEANKIIQYLAEISQGKCSITEESILDLDDPEDQSISLGLLTLFEEINFKQKVLEQSNKEKEVLLKEIQHRVKNNLQLISSLLSLHVHIANDDHAGEVLYECKNRIQTMSLIQEKLTAYKKPGKFDISHYLEDLTKEIVYMNYAPEEIEFQVEMIPIKANFSKAMSLGLILNELINNSVKHAFIEGDTKTICLKLHSPKKGHHKLEVCDYGIGYPDELFDQTQDNLGLALVKDIAQQLDGKISKKPFSEEKGTHYTIEFSI